jgi:hypothetical protein
MFSAKVASQLAHAKNDIGIRPTLEKHDDDPELDDGSASDP